MGRDQEKGSARRVRWAVAGGVCVLVLSGAFLACWLLEGGRFGEIGGKELTVYVPCGFIVPMGAVREPFMSLNPAAKVNYVVDDEAALRARVLERGERPDMVVTSGTVEMARYVAGGLVEQGDVYPIAKYSLVLYVSRANPARIDSLADLRKAEVRKISLADVASTTLGSAVKQSLSRLGWWQEIEPKVSYTPTWRVGYEAVLTSAADASFAYWKCPIKGEDEERAQKAARHRVVEFLPEGTYDPVLLQIGVLSAARHRALARTFVRFVLGSLGQQILAKRDAPNVGGPEQRPVAAGTAGMQQVSAGASPVVRWPKTGELPAAPVEVRGYFPLGKSRWEKETALLARLERMFPYEVHSEMVDFTSPEGYGLWEKQAGVTCGGIAINGQDLYEIETARGKRTVWFVHGLGEQWSEEDLLTAVKDAVQSARERRRTYRVMFSVRVPQRAATGTTRVWVPKPPSNEYQQISEFSASPEPDAIGRDPEFGNEFLYFERKAGGMPLEVVLHFTVSVAPRLRRGGERYDQSPPTRGESPEAYLRSEPALSVSERTRAIAAKLVKGKQNPFDKVKAIYDYVLDTMTYSKESCTPRSPCGLGQTERLLDVPRGACADYHALFISLCRSAGIPARQLNGNWLRVDKTTPHCWTEVFLGAEGWAPVDVSCADTGGPREFLCGNLDPLRLLLVTGTELHLDPPANAGSIGLLMRPYVEVGGEPIYGFESTLSASAVGQQ